MKVDRITLAGVLLVILAMAAVVTVITRHPFQPFSYAVPLNRLIDVTHDVGAEDSSFMWSYRSMDLIAQAFVIFAASAACLVMLRVGEKEED
jgi:hypothetical protein